MLNTVLTKETYLIDLLLKTLQEFFTLNLSIVFDTNEVDEELKPYLCVIINETTAKVRSIYKNSITATLAEFKDFHEWNLGHWQTRPLSGLFRLEDVMSLEDYQEIGQAFSWADISTVELQLDILGDTATDLVS